MPQSCQPTYPRTTQPRDDERHAGPEGDACALAVRRSPVVRTMGAIVAEPARRLAGLGSGVTERSRAARRLDGVGSTIFAEMSALAVRTGSVNLGQGFPDLSGPDTVIEAAYDAMRAGRNQYPPGRGTPELVDAVIRHQQRHYGLDLAPENVVVDDGRDRGDRRCPARAGRPRRRGRGVGALLRQLPRDDPVRRRRTTAGDPARTRLPARRRRARGGRHRPDQAPPAEHAAQPDRARLRRAPSSTPSPTWPAATTWSW